MRKGILYLAMGLVIALTACNNDVEDPGLEYAPQMYHSIPYEPLTQIRDISFEYYNSNPYNPYRMNERQPVGNTIRQMYEPAERKDAISTVINYDIPKDSSNMAKALKNPYEGDELMVKEGKVLYERYCEHCHGSEGDGQGAVGKVYKGVPNYTAGVYAQRTAGEIFHTITRGKGRMQPHASQVSVEDRWKIVLYVQKLQKGK